MEKIDFTAGDEKRFFNFISELNDKDKILLISHAADLDGIAAAKVVNEVVKPDMIKFLNYEDLNDLLIESLKRNKINKVIITDMVIKDISLIKKMESFANILIIDHHLFSEDLNSEKTVFMSKDGYCATYLSYYLFSKIQNIEKLDWVVSCASVSDWCYFKNQEFMREIYSKYGDEFFADVKKIRKGKFWDLQYTISLGIIYFSEDVQKVFDSIGEKFGDIGDLGKYAEEVRIEVSEAINRFDNEKITVKDRIFWEFNPKFRIKAMVINEISAKTRDKTLIFMSCDDKKCSMSARREDKGENMNDLMANLVKGLEESVGGGHFAAGGAMFKLKDKEEVRKRLLTL